MRAKIALRLVTIAAIASLLPSDASAYIDPSTGSLLVQSLLGAIAAGLVFGRTLWHRVKSLFRRRRRKGEEDPPVSPDDPAA
jgi:uncharacterized membrane protein YjjB (DUF3815 family)